MVSVRQQASMVSVRQQASVCVGGGTVVGSYPTWGGESRSLSARVAKLLGCGLALIKLRPGSILNLLS